MTAAGTTPTPVGKIDRQELGRMLKELDKDKLQVSETLIERYVEARWAATARVGAAARSSCWIKRSTRNLFG